MRRHGKREGAMHGQERELRTITAAVHARSAKAPPDLKAELRTRESEFVADLGGNHPSSTGVPQDFSSFPGLSGDVDPA